MSDISDRLTVEGPDRDGDYELTLRDCNCESGQHSHYINTAEARALIEALKPALENTAVATTINDLKG